MTIEWPLESLILSATLRYVRNMRAVEPDWKIVVSLLPDRRSEFLKSMEIAKADMGYNNEFRSAFELDLYHFPAELDEVVQQWES